MIGIKGKLSGTKSELKTKEMKTFTAALMTTAMCFFSQEASAVRIQGKELTSDEISKMFET